MASLSLRGSQIPPCSGPACPGSQRAKSRRWNPHVCLTFEYQKFSPGPRTAQMVSEARILSWRTLKGSICETNGDYRRRAVDLWLASVGPSRTFSSEWWFLGTVALVRFNSRKTFLPLTLYSSATPSKSSLTSRTGSVSAPSQIVSGGAHFMANQICPVVHSNPATTCSSLQ